MRGFWMVLGLCSYSVLPGALARAGELLPPETSIAAAIDHYVEQRLQAEWVTPAPLAPPAELIRRLTLDLAGRIPTAAEAQAYVQSDEPHPRAAVIDRLLASPDYAYHLRNELDALLMPQQSPNEFRAFLLEACRENRPWDALFRQLVLAREDQPAEAPALAFLKSRAKDLDNLTNDTSRLFFGISINCAKCHDHPLVLDWTQDHYYGMASFFNRTYLNKRNQLGEREEGLVSFKTTAGEERQARLMFLTGAVLDEPPSPTRSDAEQKELEKQRREADNAKEGPAPPAPSYSRRARLVEVALRSEDNHFFSRNIVNRTWARLLGRGLVMPLDQMHAENTPSHPELLNWLARDLVTHGYDLRRLIHGIVSSRTYARASRWEGSGEPPRDKLLAVAQTRPLTPRQLALSLWLATQAPERWPLDMPAEEWAKRREELENRAHGWAGLFEAPGENFQIGVNEALLFSNGAQIQNELLQSGGDRLVARLTDQTDRDQSVTLAFWSVLARAPEAEEVAAVRAFVEARGERLSGAWQHVVWALLTSSEFRFNH